MPPGKRTPPLFDLLSRSGPTGVGLPPVGQGQSEQPAMSHARMTGNITGNGVKLSPKPVVRVELKPQPHVTQAHAAHTAPAGSVPSYAPPKEPARPAANLTPSRDAESDTAWQSVVARKSQGVPVSIIYIAIAVGLGLALAAWFGGYKLGQSKTESNYKELLRKDPPKVTEPIGNAGLAVDRQPQSEPNQQTSVQPESKADLASQAGPTVLAPSPNGFVYLPEGLVAQADGVEGWTMTPKGYTKDDPLEKGVNYLPLGIFWADEAAGIVGQFAASGMQAIAVPMDKKGTPGNNRGPTYRVWAIPGLRRENFSQGRPQVEAAVARVIEVWNAEKGRSAMQMGNWEAKK